MKLFIKYLLIISAALALDSCSSGCEPDAPEVADNVTVTLNVGLDRDASRSDSPDVDRLLVCAVYDSSGNHLPELGTDNSGQIVIDLAASPAQLSLKLVKGQVYNILLWAMNSEYADAYDTADLRSVQMKPSKLPVTGGNADAFFKTETFTAVADGIRAIKLRRAVATVNLLTTASELEYVKRFADTDEAKVTFSAEVPVKFDLFTGKVSEFVDRTFAPSRFDPVFRNIDLGDDATAPDGVYAVLAEVSLFAPGQSTLMSGAMFSVNDLKINLPGFFYQRNYNTNILITDFSQYAEIPAHN